MVRRFRQGEEAGGQSGLQEEGLQVGSEGRRATGSGNKVARWPGHHSLGRKGWVCLGDRVEWFSEEMFAKGRKRWDLAAVVQL